MTFDSSFHKLFCRSWCSSPPTRPNTHVSGCWVSWSHAVGPLYPCVQTSVPGSPPCSSRTTRCSEHSFFRSAPDSVLPRATLFNINAVKNHFSFSFVIIGLGKIFSPFSCLSVLECPILCRNSISHMAHCFGNKTY